MVGADRVRRDDHSLYQRVRGGHHQRDVLAGTRLGFVGIDYQVLGLGVVLRDEAPFHSGRKTRTATAAEAGVLDESDHIGWLHLQRRTEGVISATALVVAQLPGALICPVNREYWCQGIG